MEVTQSNESTPRRKPIAVLKIGGSILTNADAYRKAALFIHDELRTRPDARYLVVVSAQNGTTDELEKAARSISETPDPRMLDLLWTTGEIRSVALLSLHLQAVGLRAVGLNVHQTGLICNEETDSQAGVRLAVRGLQTALTQNAVVVVPGFFATRSDGSIVSLGRGGSDLSAVLLAVGFKAVRCELLKDVAGYFTADPNVETNAEHIPALTYRQATELAERGCELVQRQAIELARDFKLRLIVRSMSEDAPWSLVD